MAMCKCFCGACGQNLHEHCSNADNSLCRADCGCNCKACKRTDHRNCSHVNECPQKATAAPVAPAAQSAAPAIAPSADLGELDPFLHPAAALAPRAAAPAAAPPAPVASPPVALPAAPQAAPQAQPLASIFDNPEAQAAAREILAGRQRAAAVAPSVDWPPPQPTSRSVEPPSRELDPAWRINADLAALEATLSIYEDEVATKAPGPARNKVLLELAQSLAAIREVGVKAHELAKMLEKVRVAASQLDGGA